MANTEQEREAWLAKVSEAALEPELPIVDPHHHLWDHPGSRYMLDEILRDTNTGHRVLATVFVECMSMYRADGPESMRPVGETEFVNGIAAQSASGQYGDTRVAAGIVSFADLTLGGAVTPVLEAHIARLRRASVESDTRAASTRVPRCAIRTPTRRLSFTTRRSFARALRS